MKPEEILMRVRGPWMQQPVDALGVHFPSPRLNGAVRAAGSHTTIRFRPTRAVLVSQRLGHI